KLRSQATQSRWQRVHLSPVRGDWAVISGVRAKGLILNTPVSQVVQRVNTWNARDRHEEFVAAACIIHLRGGAGEILRAYYYTAAIWRLCLRLTWSQRSWHSFPESEVHAHNEQNTSDSNHSHRRVADIFPFTVFARPRAAARRANACHEGAAWCFRGHLVAGTQALRAAR